MNIALNSSEKVSRLTNMKNWERKEFIRSLRNNGLSYKEIIKDSPFAISKSTVSDWCKDIKLTVKQKNRLEQLFKDGSYRGRLAGSKVTQTRRAEEVANIRRQAKSEISSLTGNEFKIAGLMLYWAEGAKSGYVDITNSDPAIIKFMVTWLRTVCEVSEERFRVSLHLHSGQSEEEIKKYWSKITNIRLSQFRKSYIKKEGSGYRKNILYKGTIKVRVCDSNLLHKILGWIEGVKSSTRAISSIGGAGPS